MFIYFNSDIYNINSIFKISRECIDYNNYRIRLYLVGEPIAITNTGKEVCEYFKTKDEMNTRFNKLMVAIACYK